MNGLAVKAASEKQLKFVRDLMADRDTEAFIAGLPVPWQIIYEGIRADTLDFYAGPDVSKFIDALLKLPKAEAAVHIPRRIQAKKPAALEDGFYLHGGTYYRVVHNRAGTNQYAMRMKFLLTIEEAKALAGTGAKRKVFKWVFAPGSILAMKPEEHVTNTDLTSQFGGLYSACCECGALLNDPLSVELNIGPVCGARVFGEVWKGMLVEAKAAVEAK